VPIEDASADVRASFRNTEKYDVDDAPAYFEEVTIELAIVSDAIAENVRKLVTHAERACHAAQSLSHPVPVHLQATLNRQPLS
jgi:organic hydroperoxide reductase OsmC/OhrA